MSSQQQAEKTAEQHFQDGLAFSKLGDDRRTFESYKKALELDPDYFDIACKRVHEAWKQPRLFDEPKAKPAQPAHLFDDGGAG